MDEFKVVLNDALLYTYKNKRVSTRFDNYKRDVLSSKIKIIESHTYKPYKKGIEKQPDKRLTIISYSHPQYKPYTKHTQGTRQKKYIHEYDIILVLQKDTNNEFSLQSKVKWRIGSFKKWDSNPPQNKIKTIYSVTKEKLKKRFKNDIVSYNKELVKLRKNGKYLDVGDYNSRELGLNGDAYWRDFYLQKIHNCLFGPIWNNSKNTKEPKIQYPFLDKHMIGIILYMIKKNYLKK